MDRGYWNLELGGTLSGRGPSPQKRTRYVLGVLPGEGIGPEIIDVSLRVLEAATKRDSVRIDIRRGGKIGLEAYQEKGCFLTTEVAKFCESVFGEGGAILCGPGGGRFVYELRTRFDLFCKISPIRPLAPLADAGAIKPQAKEGVDILLIRENSGGAYLGRWRHKESLGKKMASHYLEYQEEEVERIVRVALALAMKRRGRLALILKTYGLPSISELWVAVTEKLAKGSGVGLDVLQVDNAAFQLVHDARSFDVAVSSNLLGDILADYAGVLLGSRGLCYSGNFGSDGKAVYQTGHGAAHDLQDSDLANPIGQILSLAMLLEVSFGLTDIAGLILNGLEKTLADGWRTKDIANPDHPFVGTREFGKRLIHCLETSLTEPGHDAR